MLKLKSITYDPSDLIQLLKLNTSLMVTCNPNELYVDFRFSGNGKISAEVKRIDKKDLEIRKINEQ